MSNFCQFKTAYMLGPESENLTKAIVDGKIYHIISDSKLPDKWEFMGTEIAGASGFVLLFESYDLPIQSDLDSIEIYLKDLERSK